MVLLQRKDKAMSRIIDRVANALEALFIPLLGLVAALCIINVVVYFVS
jgi:hypothetical protein